MLHNRGITLQKLDSNMSLLLRAYQGITSIQAFISCLKEIVNMLCEFHFLNLLLSRQHVINFSLKNCFVGEEFDRNMTTAASQYLPCVHQNWILCFIKYMCHNVNHLSFKVQRNTQHISR